MPTNTLSADTDLEALFDISIDANTADIDTGAWDKIKCGKCAGKGVFYSWNGRAVGKCYTCDGKGFC